MRYSSIRRLITAAMLAAAAASLATTPSFAKKFHAAATQTETSRPADMAPLYGPNGSGCVEDNGGGRVKPACGGD